MGAFYTLETKIVVPNGQSGGAYCLGLSSATGIAGSPFRCPSSGIVHSIAVTMRDPAIALPGAGTYALGGFAVQLTAGGQAETDRATFCFLHEQPITPGVAAPAYGAAGMFYQGSSASSAGAGVYKVRTPDGLFNNGGSGYKYSCGRVIVPAAGRLWFAVELAAANATGSDIEFQLGVAIEGRDSLNGDPASFYRNHDPGSF